MINSNIHQSQVNLTGILFEVALIQTINLKYFLIQTITKFLFQVCPNSLN